LLGQNSEIGGGVKASAKVGLKAKNCFFIRNAQGNFTIGKHPLVDRFGKFPRSTCLLDNLSRRIRATYINYLAAGMNPLTKTSESEV